MKSLLLLTSLFLSVSAVTFSQPLRHILEIQPPFSEDRQLGISILGVGDVNGDGWPDLAVGASGPKKTFFYWGGPGILDTTADFSIPYVGRVMKLADLNGDGKKDLILSERDTIWVFFGKDPPPIAFDTVPGLVLHGESLGDSFGGINADAFAVGDLNGDGFDDLVVGAQSYQGKGKVYVYLGKPAPTTTPDFTAVGDFRSGFGVNVDVGDLNGDGFDDLVVAARRRVMFPQEDQTLYIWQGSSDFAFHKNNYVQRIDKHIDDGLLFIYFFTLIDYNLDGKADIFYPDSGRAFFHWGRTDSIRHNPDFIINPFGIFPRYPLDVFSIGDVNNDGIPDFAFWAGSEFGGYCVSVFLGNPPAPMTTTQGSRCNISESAFRFITGVGDINGDGVGDFASSVPFYEGGSAGYVVILSGDKSWKTPPPPPPPPVPKDFGLSQNYPNPFNPGTAIEYHLARNSSVLLVVHDTLGKELIRLVDEQQKAGYHKVEWDGRTASGERASSGLYLYSLFIDGKPVQTGKALLLK